MGQIKLVSGAETKIYRQQHQTRSMGGCDDEGPECKLRGSDAGKHARMSPVNETEDAKGDYGGARTDPDFVLPVQQRGHRGKRQKNDEHRHQVPDRKRHQGRHYVSSAMAHQPGGNGQWPTHSWIDAVIEAANDHGQPKTDRGPLNVVHLQTEG